jgi:hypothetical protein
VHTAPTQPSQAEREAHEATHLPYRSWCRHCVRGKGKSESHKRLDAEKEHTIPTVSMDYCFMGQVDDDKTLPILGIRDHRHKVTYSHVVPSKGTKHPYSVGQVVHDIDQLGYSKLILKNDQEPAIVDLQKQVIVELKEKGIECIPENSPVSESQSNGVIERGIQDIEGQVRVLKDMLDQKYNRKIESTHPILPWLVNHAGVLITRFQVGVDGRTAYERLKGKPFRKALVPIGESVHYQPLGRAKANRMEKLNKLDNKWRDGIYLGIKDNTNEVFVGTNNGVFKVQSVRRKPEQERYQWSELEKMVGLPWKPTPSSEESTEVPPSLIVIPASTDDSIPVLPPVEREVVPRQVYIQR